MMRKFGIVMLSCPTFARRHGHCQLLQPFGEVPTDEVLELQDVFAVESINSLRTFSSIGGGGSAMFRFSAYALRSRRSPLGTTSLRTDFSGFGLLRNVCKALFFGMPDGIYLKETSGINVSSTPRKRYALCTKPRGSSFRSS